MPYTWWKLDPFNYTRVSVDVGLASDFRNNINTNFTNISSAMNTWANTNGVTELVNQLVDFVGDWDSSAWGNIGSRLGGPKTGRRIFISIGNDLPLSELKVNDIRASVYNI